MPFAPMSAMRGSSTTPPFRLSSLIQPTIGIVFLLVWIPPGEKTIQIFRVLIRLRNNHRRIRVMNQVLAEEKLVFEGVMNQRAQKQNVRSCAERQPDIRHRGCAAESRIDVNDLR